MEHPAPARLLWDYTTTVCWNLFRNGATLPRLRQEPAPRAMLFHSNHDEPSRTSRKRRVSANELLGLWRPPSLTMTMRLPDIYGVANYGKNRLYHNNTEALSPMCVKGGVRIVKPGPTGLLGATMIATSG